MNRSGYVSIVCLGALWCTLATCWPQDPEPRLGWLPKTLKSFTMKFDIHRKRWKQLNGPPLEKGDLPEQDFRAVISFEQGVFYHATVPISASGELESDNQQTLVLTNERSYLFLGRSTCIVEEGRKHRYISCMPAPVLDIFDIPFNKPALDDPFRRAEPKLRDLKLSDLVSTPSFDDGLESGIRYSTGMRVVAQDGSIEQTVGHLSNPYVRWRVSAPENIGVIVGGRTTTYTRNKIAFDGVTPTPQPMDEVTMVVKSVTASGIKISLSDLYKGLGERCSVYLQKPSGKRVEMDKASEKVKDWFRDSH